MKRLSLSFLIVASLMLMLAVPTFAESSKMHKSNAGVEMKNTQRSITNGGNGNTMNGTAGTNGYNTSTRVHSDSNYSTYGNEGTRAYGMDNGRYRTTAANNDRGMDWGWLGLLGLLGLAGMRGRNRESH